MDSLIDKFGDKVTACFVERVSMDEEGLKNLKKELDRVEEAR